MCSPFICGNFQDQEDEDNMETLMSPCSTPKRSRKSVGSYKNRYANVGLNKFNALLSQLEEQRQKIYTQNGSEDIASVQFVISSDNEIKPIVFKKTDPSSKARQKVKTNTQNHESSSEKKMEDEELPKKKRGCESLDFLKLEKIKPPFYYFPIVVILILLFLAIYGKPFAILCTAIGWYLVPLLRGGNVNSSSNGTSNNPRKLKRKKEHYTRRVGEKTINNNDGSSSPTSVFNGPSGTSPPRQHGHRRSQ